MAVLVTDLVFMKMSTKMIAYCGLVCTECPGYLATQANDPVAAQKVAAEWSKAYHTDVKVEHVWCDGCTTPGRKCSHCSECEIRGCVLERGLTTCGPCADYPCPTITGFLTMVPAVKATLDRLHAARQSS